MNPTEEQIAALLGTSGTDVPPPDRPFLDRLREQTAKVFQAAGGNNAVTSPRLPRKTIMIFSSFRWIAATAAAVLVLGVVVANWMGLFQAPRQTETPREEQFIVADTLADDGRIGKVTDAQGIVSIKPVEHERWSPVEPRLVLRPAIGCGPTCAVRMPPH